VILWKKLAVNAVINPLTAIHNIKNGQLADAQFSDTIAMILKEWRLVAQSCGIQIKLEEMSKVVYDVIHKTANNYSSMNRDIAAGKITEIEFINGFIINQAEINGIAVPENKKLVKRINQLERKY